MISWRLDAEVAGLAMLAAGDAASMLSGVNPSLFTIRTFRSAGTAQAAFTQQDIRMGMGLGSALALVVGFGATLASKSWWPTLVTLITLAVLDGAYEAALRNPHNTHKSIADQ